jgi:hypothetical protein
MNSKNQIPKSFWAELEEIYNLEIREKDTFDKNGQNQIPESFWFELQELYQLEERSGVFSYTPESEPENSVLEELEKAFERINDNAKEVVELEKHKNPNNPLFFPFSLFQPMKKERNEEHYTKTLAWIMNNDAEILKEIMVLFGFEIDSFKKHNVEAEVWSNRLENRLDIAVMDGNQIVVAIEAKVDSEEGKKSEKEEEIYQLEAYDKWLDECHPICKTRIFLVVEKDIEISSENWEIFTWKDVAITLLKFLENDNPPTPDYYYVGFFVTSIIQDIYGIDPKNNLVTANFISLIKEK